MSRTKRILRWSAITIGGALGVLVLGLAGLYAWAQSDAGRSWIARSLEDALGRPGELTLHIGALEDMDQSKSKIFVDGVESPKFFGTPLENGKHYRAEFTSRDYDSSKDTDFMPPDL